MKMSFRAMAAAAACAGFCFGQVDLSGTVTDVGGAPIHGALVRMLAGQLWDTTDAAGKYKITGAPGSATLPSDLQSGSVQYSSITNGRFSFSLPEKTPVSVEMFDLTGRRVASLMNEELPAGEHTVDLRGSRVASAVLLLRAAIGPNTRVLRYVPMTLGGSAAASVQRSTQTILAKAYANVDTLRASAPGYYAESKGIGAYTGVVDFTLLKPDSTKSTMGTAAQVDGSADRMAAYGRTQYFWADVGGDSTAFVQVVSAVSDQAVDIMLTFSPDFVDLTYGQNIEGWKHHSFMDLVKSDHIEVILVGIDSNAVKDTVLHIKLDLISPCPDAPSGYCALGVGGDGQVISGDASKIISWGTSMDDNLNYYACADTANSPATDSNYTPNASCPEYQYFASYRLTVDPSLFGSSEFYRVNMTYVHASPAKTPTETYDVFEGGTPPPDDDPWKEFNPFPVPQDTIPVRPD
jgi:hypothetical protein